MVRALAILCVVLMAAACTRDNGKAVEALASKAEKADQKSDLWVRAARMLEEKGDKDGAIERYKAALDALPSNTSAALALRAAYLARGDAASAVELIARDIEVSDGKIAKGRLYGEMAVLLREKLRDNARAAEAAKKAVDNDPTRPGRPDRAAGVPAARKRACPAGRRRLGSVPVTAVNDLFRPDRYPRASGYDPAWLLDLDMGPNPLWLLEDVARGLDLRPGMRVLDLGSGKGATSVFLAREYGVRVVAADWWIGAEEAAIAIRALGRNR